MHAFTILGDPVRRRIVEVLAESERSAGEVVEIVGAEFGISQSAVSQHLAMLRDNGFATVRPEGSRRIYALEPDSLRDVDAWVERFRPLWSRHLDALQTEIARGKRATTQKDSP
jgi:DNA-binding transcriptional ArsR family regulator